MLNTDLLDRPMLRLVREAPNPGTVMGPEARSKPFQGW